MFMYDAFSDVAGGFLDSCYFLYIAEMVLILPYIIIVPFGFSFLNPLLFYCTVHSVTPYEGT